MFLSIALLGTPYSLLTYRASDDFPPDFWRPGLRCIVPLGRGKRFCAGICLQRTETSDLPPTVKIKDVLWPLEVRPALTQDLLELLLEMSKRQGTDFGRIAQGCLPLGLRTLELNLHTIAHGKRNILSFAKLAEIPPEERHLLACQLLAGTATLLPKIRDADDIELFDLACDPPWPVRPNAKQQINVLEFLYTQGAKNRNLLRAALGQAAMPALEALCAAGYVQRKKEEEGDETSELAQQAPLLPPLERPFALNGDQESVLGILKKVIFDHRQATYLLYGVTGSGKTAVYLDLAVTCLRQGRSAFLLVPEVALALKLLQDARHIYPDIPWLLYHGYQSQNYRENIWRSLSDHAAVCVIGTRSALFLPVCSLGCIILDEEHDASFKQEEGLSYHAKEIAWFRTRQHKALLVLGSATPDIRTFYAARMGQLDIVTLPHRISGRALPPIDFVDLQDTSQLSESVPLLSKVSLAALEETVKKGEQAVIFINRRGFAPHMYCCDCGKTERCPDCEIGLTYHKARNRLVCHYCGYTRPFPSPCSSCGSVSFLPLGEGTERLAEEVSAYLGQRVLRLDRDSTRRAGTMEEILTSFARQEAQVLVGTQMLSKGHHFPKVTLVIAADADMGLNLPDYRASERTFQLLIQAAGRAGRGALPGRVLLQTRDSSHYCWSYVRTNDYEGFYSAELARRKRHRYPPFSHLALIRISFDREEQKALTELATYTQAVQNEARSLGVIVLGPAPAPLAMLRGRKRFQCLLKSQDWSSIRELFHRAQSVRVKTLRIALDLDPVNML